MSQARVTRCTSVKHPLDLANGPRKPIAEDCPHTATLSTAVGSKRATGNSARLVARIETAVGYISMEEHQESLATQKSVEPELALLTGHCGSSKARYNRARAIIPGITF